MACESVVLRLITYFITPGPSYDSYSDDIQDLAFITHVYCISDRVHRIEISNLAEPDYGFAQKFRRNPAGFAGFEINHKL